MSKVSTVPRPPQRFDLQKFETMNEPFSILVQKHRGSTKHDVTPPTPDDGQGWTKERVRALENWIVTEWSGGGHYTFAITDSSAPPQAMEWMSFYPPSDFPEKIPQSLQQATQIQPMAQQQQQPSTPTVPAQPGTVTQLRPGVLPPGSYYAQQPAQQQQQPQPQPQIAPPLPIQVPSMNFPQAFPQPTTLPLTESAEVRLLREQLAKAREEAAQRDFERRVAEMKAESDKRFTELQQLIQSQQAVAVSQRPAIDPALEELKAQNRALQDQMRMQQDQIRQQAEAADRARREQEMRDQIKAGQEETRRLVEQLTQRQEQALREAGNKGPDPQFMLMMQVMKDIASSSQSQFDRLQNMMMRPQDILAIAKESATGTDHIVNNIARQYEGMFNLQRQFTEQVAQMNQGQGGNEVIGLIKDVGEKVGEWAGRYSTGKSREEVERMRSQAEVAKAQAEVVKAQQERMSEMARMEAAVKSGAVVQMPDGSFRGAPGHEPIQIAAPAPNGTNGHSNGKPPWVPPKAGKTNGAGLSGPVIVEEPKTQIVDSVPNAKNKPAGASKIMGYSDDEWFGPMLPDVHRLRGAVDLFIKGVNENPPRKPEESAAPEECAFAINQAAAEIMRLQIPIMAVQKLLLEGRVADFLDVLLPSAPQVFRDDVVKLLMQDDGEEDEDETEEAHAD